VGLNVCRFHAQEGTIPDGAKTTGSDGDPLQVETERSPIELARMVAFALEPAKRNPAPEPVVILAHPNEANPVRMKSAAIILAAAVSDGQAPDQGLGFCR